MRFLVLNTCDFCCVFLCISVIVIENACNSRPTHFAKKWFLIIKTV